VLGRARPNISKTYGNCFFSILNIHIGPKTWHSYKNALLKDAGTVRIRAFMADFRTRHLENKAELSATRGRGWLRRCQKDPRHPGCAIVRPQKIFFGSRKNIFDILVTSTIRARLCL
jgi:hypothetical protein